MPAVPRGAWLGPVCRHSAPLPRARGGAGRGVSGGSAGANAQAHTTHARTGGRAGGRAARARRARMGRRGAAVFGCSLRAHHSPDSASSSTREPAPRQRPPERMRDRDFEREPDEPGVCGLDGSGRAGERSGVRQLMGDGVPMFVVARLARGVYGVARSDAERVLTRGHLRLCPSPPPSSLHLVSFSLRAHRPQRALRLCHIVCHTARHVVCTYKVNTYSRVFTQDPNTCI